MKTTIEKCQAAIANYAEEMDKTGKKTIGIELEERDQVRERDTKVEKKTNKTIAEWIL